MPAGHGGIAHGFEIQLPGDIGSMLAQHIDALEQEQARLAKSNRRNTWVFWGMLVALGLNALSALYSLFVSTT